MFHGCKIYSGNGFALCHVHKIVFLTINDDTNLLYALNINLES